MSSHTSLTPPTMLTSQRRPDHALHTKVRLVKLPEADELINNSLLLRNTIQFRYKAWVASHAAVVEPSAETESACENEVHEKCPVCALGSKCRAR